MMKDELYILISEKQEQVKKLQKEIRLLFLIYHSLPTDNEIKEEQENLYKEYLKKYYWNMEPK